MNSSNNLNTQLRCRLHPWLQSPSTAIPRFPAQGIIVNFSSLLHLIRRLLYYLNNSLDLITLVAQPDSCHVRHRLLQCPLPVNAKWTRCLSIHCPLMVLMVLPIDTIHIPDEFPCLSLLFHIATEPPFLLVYILVALFSWNVM